MLAGEQLEAGFGQALAEEAHIVAELGAEVVAGGGELDRLGAPATIAGATVLEKR